MKKLIVCGIGLFLLLVLEVALLLWMDWPPYFMRAKQQAQIVQVISEQEARTGTVVEGPIYLGGGICLYGVDFGGGRQEIRAVIASDQPKLSRGQKVEVKSRLISETYHEAFGLWVMQNGGSSKSQP